MKNLSFVLLLASSTLCFGASHPGYVDSAHDTVVRDGHNTCVHTTYFNKAANGIAECGEAPAPKAAPVVVAPAKPTTRIVDETITLSDADHVLFNFDKATLTKDGENSINDILAKINSEADVTKVTIDGYTDALGNPVYNQKLSQKRADTVKRYFISKNFSEDKLLTHGFGAKDSQVSSQCFSDIGKDPYLRIWALEAKLKKHKIRKVKAELAKLKKLRANLISCASPDRRVVFTIEHTEQIQKEVPANASDATSSQTSNTVDTTPTDNKPTTNLDSQNSSTSDVVTPNSDGKSDSSSAQ